MLRRKPRIAGGLAQPLQNSGPRIQVDLHPAILARCPPGPKPGLAPHASPAHGSIQGNPRAGPPRKSPICWFARMPNQRLSRCFPSREAGGSHRANQRGREPPFKFAFFNRLSYWWDIKCACTWAMKSITTTTTISSEVPPK